MKFTRPVLIAPVLASLLLMLAGCGGSGNSGNSPSSSTSYTANSIFAFMKAVQDESGNVTTTVQLRDGMLSTAKYLYLGAGDILYTSLDVPPQQYMNFSGNLFSNSLALSQHLKVAAARDLYTDYFLFTQTLYGKPEYFSADTPSTSSLPVRAYVDFERAGNLFTGPSSVDLPPAYQIAAPTRDAIVSRAAPLALTWTNVDATTTMRLNVAGICVDGSRYTQSYNIGIDTGTATLSSANYFPATGTSPSTNCRVAFILQRVRTAGVSPQFAFGSFDGVQQRTVQFTTTP